MSDTQSFFHKPLNFSGYADLAEYRWKATAAMLMLYGPLCAKAIGAIAIDTALIALLFALVYNLVWFLPLMVRRARSAGIHWMVSLLLGLAFTLIFAIVLAFLPEKASSNTLKA